MLNPYGVNAAREYLLERNLLTRLEAMVLFAVPDLTKIISDLRHEGHDVERRTVPLARANPPERASDLPRLQSQKKQ